MKKIFNSRAQSILDYVLLAGIVAAALMGMQVYMKRGIQATVKDVADLMGDQRRGLAEYDYRGVVRRRDAAEITAASRGSSNITKSEGGAVSYGTRENPNRNTETKTGLLSREVSFEEE